MHTTVVFSLVEKQSSKHKSFRYIDMGEVAAFKT